jgi:ABC-type thiamine transport system ATPase subunit
MLTLHDVSVCYDGVPAVRDTSLELPDGQVLAVLGPSGCGKSTLLRAVAGLEPLEAGRIFLDGRDISELPTHKRGFALMFQDGQLFGHLTVARNIGYARPPSPVVSGSGWRWPAASPYAPGCCSSTNRCPPSTPGCGSGWPVIFGTSSPTRRSPR